MTREEWYAARRRAREILRKAEKKSTDRFLYALGFIVRQFGPVVEESLAHGPEETYVVHAGNFARYRRARPETRLKWQTVYGYRWSAK